MTIWERAREIAQAWRSIPGYLPDESASGAYYTFQRALRRARKEEDERFLPKNYPLLVDFDLV